jgi:hypothetical protein
MAAMKYAVLEDGNHIRPLLEQFKGLKKQDMPLIPWFAMIKSTISSEMRVCRRFGQH